MAARPIMDSAEQCGSRIFRIAESVGQGKQLALFIVSEHDFVGNRERRHIAILDEIVGERRSEQTTGQPSKEGVLAPEVEEMAQCAEKTFRGETQSPANVDLVDEEDEPVAVADAFQDSPEPRDRPQLQSLSR